jgi:hypothetical protein
MAAPNYHNFEYTQSVNPGHQQFETIGHPGRYTGVYRHRSGEFYFTGSNYGYGAMLIGSGSGAGFSGYDYDPGENAQPDFLELSGGGRIDLADLVHTDDVEATRPQIYEFSCYRVSSSLGAPDIYFFKRQQ